MQLYEKNGETKRTVLPPSLAKYPRFDIDLRAWFAGRRFISVNFTARSSVNCIGKGFFEHLGTIFPRSSAGRCIGVFR